MDQRFARLIDQAEAHRLCMQVDAAVEFMLPLLESHHGVAPDRQTALSDGTINPAAGERRSYPMYTNGMNRTIRTGFDAQRKLTLDQEDDHGVLLDATPSERLAMVWPITESCWAFMPGAGKYAQREFQRHVVCIRRGRG